jgi:RNA polymerase sigma-70 factor (ECF subfamily)
MEPVAAETSDGASQEDRALVERFLSTREEHAFRLLYRRHAPALFRFATRLAGGREDGEDLLQETWIRAAGRLADFRWESALRTWLFGIAVNRWREVLRARSRRPGLALVSRLENEDGVPIAPDAAMAMDLDRAIASLPDGYREVLVLHDVHGYTHEEIARMLEIETGTSKSQLSRARRALRERFRIDGSRGGTE